jgi:hypothetical protein
LRDEENQYYENEEHFKKIVGGLSFKLNDPSAFLAMEDLLFRSLMSGTSTMSLRILKEYYHTS